MNYFISMHTEAVDIEAAIERAKQVAAFLQDEVFVSNGFEHTHRICKNGDVLEV